MTYTGEPIQQKTPLDRQYDKNTKSLYYVDLIRTYAILMVVCVHAASPPMLNFSEISPSAWWVSNILFSYAHQGVPLFIMVSGLLLLDPTKIESMSTFFRKRLMKVVLPFFFWSLFYYLWRIFFNEENLTFYQAVKIMAEGPVYYHLWFIYLIVGLYLATPILRCFSKSAQKTGFIYFIALWFTFRTLVPLFSHLTEIQLGVQNILFHGLLGYYLLGYLLNQRHIPKKYIGLVVVFIGLATLLTAMGTHYIVAQSDGEYSNFFTRYYQPNVIAISVGVFLLMMRWQHAKLLSNPLTSTIVRHIAVASFGIYLLHPAILDMLHEGWLGFELNAMSFHPILGIPLTVFVTTTISLIIVLTLRRIPVVRTIVP